VEKLDLKDKKILYHLNIDSRQSFRSIGRKVGLSKDIVTSRVKRFHEKGIINDYFLDVDTFKLGYHSLRFYLTFQYVSPEIKNEIISYFVKNKYVVGVSTVEGQFDLVIFISVDNIANFSFTWDKIINKYRDFFTSQVFTTICGITEYKPFFLLNEKETLKINHVHEKYYDEGTRVNIDELDKKILKILNNEIRIPTIKIAEKLKTTSNTIKNRINNLIKSGIILGFRTDINYPKIGLKWYKADIFLKDLNKTQEIIRFIESNPNLSYIMKSIGYCDLEIVFNLNNVNQLHQIMEEVSKKFPDAIKNYTYFSIVKTYKYQALKNE
jgi:Lrp/AsnC family transcriptional regulator for asnA, asnC and gidA